jgi:hypothetical protein
LGRLVHICPRLGYGFCWAGEHLPSLTLRVLLGGGKRVFYTHC